MAYVTTVPGATQRINETQAPIQNNFAAIKTAFDVNHTALDDTVAQGFHKFLTMPEQAATPATAADQVALFSRQGAHSPTASQLCFKKEDGTVVEFTAGILAAPGWTRLPSGLLLKWGVFNHGLADLQAHADIFPVLATIPAFAHVYSCSLTTARTPADDVYGFLQSITTTTINWYAERRLSNAAPAVAFSVHYIVIGD